METHSLPVPPAGLSPEAGPALQACHYLPHVLSPLEMAAHRAGFKAFSYSFGDVQLPINAGVADILKEVYGLRLLLCEQFAAQVQALYDEAGPSYAPFLSRPLAEIGLSTRLRHLLMRAQCDTLLDVARRGPTGFSSVRSFGPKALQELKEFFVREGYEELFQ